MRITEIYVRNNCLVFCTDDGCKSIYHLSNIVVDTGLSIDSLSAEKLSESRVQEIIEAEGEQISIIEIKGLIGRLENAESCLDANYNEASHSFRNGDKQQSPLGD
ncbi:hypothetical protein [Nostoc sp. TCL240-02]|uniref:hypothetical protein n=1 Tax=Nostoc sp. TCL240-02 TaxID=2572090 RepID=UPI00157F86BF|nr:hypothetical protein [Nostoc sp. TCL240-02]QKQ75209.1 hypothetical protein FBB35_19630 [Nostoc sp. TCL240-02]